MKDDSVFVYIDREILYSINNEIIMQQFQITKLNSPAIILTHLQIYFFFKNRIFFVLLFYSIFVSFSWTKILTLPLYPGTTFSCYPSTIESYKLSISVLLQSALYQLDLMSKFY